MCWQEFDIEVAMAFGEDALLGGSGSIAILSITPPQPAAVGSNYHQFPAITSNRKHISGGKELS
jgi:hypothetical protein